MDKNRNSMNTSLSSLAAFLDLPIPESDPLVSEISIDSRTLKPGGVYIAIRGERYDGHDFIAAAIDAGACGVIVERIQSLDVPQLVVRDTRQALSVLASAWRKAMPATVIGVTGSNGKTSVKEMIRVVLSQKGGVIATRGNLNNEIGVPLTLLSIRPEHEYAVIEMGASGPGEIGRLSHIAMPDIALITNAAAAHLAGFGTVRAVASAKGEIYTGLKEGGTAVINHDDPNVGVWWHMSGGMRQIGFSVKGHADIHAECIELNAFEGSRFMLVTPSGAAEVVLSLPGTHSIANVLAAAAVAYAAGLSATEIAREVSRVKSIPSRLAMHRLLNGTVLIDDTYNANPASIKTGLNVLSQARQKHRWLVLGDMHELGDSRQAYHAQVGRDAFASGVERLFAIGELSGTAVDCFSGKGETFANPEALVRSLWERLCLSGEGSDTVILVKGSRSSRMERVVHALIDEAGTGESGDEGTTGQGHGGATCCFI